MTAKSTPVAVQFPIEVEDLGRAGFYGVLARLFSSAPDAPFLEVLRAQPSMDAEVGEIARCWNGLVGAVPSAASASEEYNALFLGIGRARVMLYGSYYLAGFMMEKPLAALRSDLAALGLARTVDTREPEDHFASLMEAMRHLVLDNSRGSEERGEMQQKFFSKHVEPWYARFTDALEGAEEAVFYRQAARFARAFLDIEKEAFSISA